MASNSSKNQPLISIQIYTYFTFLSIQIYYHPELLSGICCVLFKFWCFSQMLVGGTSDTHQTEFHKVEINLHTHSYTRALFFQNIQIQKCQHKSKHTFVFTPWIFHFLLSFKWRIPEALDCRYVWHEAAEKSCNSWIKFINWWTFNCLWSNCSQIIASCDAIVFLFMKI